MEVCPSVKVTMVADIHWLATAGQIVAGVPFVITADYLAAPLYSVKNGVQIAQRLQQRCTFSATTGARIGMTFDGILPAQRRNRLGSPTPGSTSRR
jgi:hypothetical protein